MVDLRNQKDPSGEKTLFARTLFGLASHSAQAAKLVHAYASVAEATRNPNIELPPDTIAFRERLPQDQLDALRFMADEEMDEEMDMFIDLQNEIADNAESAVKVIFSNAFTKSDSKAFNKEFQELMASEDALTKQYEALGPDEKKSLDQEEALLLQKHNSQDEAEKRKLDKTLEKLRRDNNNNPKIFAYDESAQKHNAKAEAFLQKISADTPKKLKQNIKSLQANLQLKRNKLNPLQTKEISRLNTLIDNLQRQKRSLEAQIQAAPANAAEIARLTQANAELIRQRQAAQANPYAQESTGKASNENNGHSTGKVVGITLGSLAFVSIPLIIGLIMQNQQNHRFQAQQAAR